MLNKVRPYVLLFFISAMFYPASAETPITDEPEPHRLSWQEVPGAAGYVIEIRNASAYMVVSEKIVENSYTLVNFTSGNYEHRVGVINKLGKVGSFSGWVALEVIVSRVPTLTKDHVYSLSKEEKTKKIELEGKDFIDPMKVYMVIDGKKIPARKVIIESPNKAIAIFDIDPNIDTGIFDLLLENPRKKILFAKQRIVVSESKEKSERFANRQERILKKEIPENYYETPYWSTFWRSSLMPGWGQTYIDGNKWKRYVYPVIALGIAGAYANANAQFHSARASYDNAVILGLFLTEESNSQIIWFQNQNTAFTKFNTAKQQLNTVKVGAGIFGVFMLYNILDSYFSAKRNVAGHNLEPGFPIGQETVRVSAKMGRDLPFPSQGLKIGQDFSSYELELSLRY